ncbi:MAG: hypothetical protein KDI80_13300 [Xanthomonadales bacterium]|nr:hypothetical protein [Xanthomonadales bacterium]
MAATVPTRLDSPSRSQDDVLNIRSRNAGHARAWHRIPIAVLAWSATALLLLEGAYYALCGVLQVTNFGWRQLMFDQYKMYPHYLELPFPQSVIQLENGHRPLLPILIRLAEIRWFSADQILQLAVGAFCAFMIAALVAISAWRDRTVSTPIRAACVATAFVGIFWLGSSRMLLHGNEILVVYMLGFLVVLGALCVQRAATAAPNRWMLGATVAATGATFCFGSGIAAFPALALVAWISRVPYRSIGWLALGLAFSLVIYLWVLPGNDSVRAMLDFRPLDSIATAVRWIGSPWINAWIGYTEPQLFPWMGPGSSRTATAQLLAGSARFLDRIAGGNLPATGALVTGLSGFLIVSANFVRRALRPMPVPCIENLAMTLSLFAAAVSMIIGIGRLDYFVDHPNQIFADRYLPWSCMFWLGCGILAMRGLDRSGMPVRMATVIVAIAVPVALLPSQRGWAGWGEAVFRQSQASAAAALSDVYDAKLFPDNDDAKTADVVRTLSLLRKRQLGMFATTGAELLGTQLVVEGSTGQTGVWISPPERLTDARNGLVSAHFEGIVVDGIRWVSQGGTLAVVDADNRVSGFALPSFVGKAGTHPRLHVPQKRGFDGYIHAFDPARDYRLVLVGSDSAVVHELAKLPTSPK